MFVCLFLTSANSPCLVFIDVFISDGYNKRSSSMLEDVIRFDKTILAQEQQIR